MIETLADVDEAIGDKFLAAAPQAILNDKMNDKTAANTTT